MTLNLYDVTNIFVDHGWYSVGETQFASANNYVLTIYDNQKKITVRHDTTVWTVSRLNTKKQRFQLWNDTLVRWDEMTRLLSALARDPAEFVRTMTPQK